MKNSVNIHDSWFVRTWFGIRSWFRYTFNKWHLNLIKEAYKGRPWDDSYLTDLEAAKIREMMHYHERADRFVGVEYAIRDMRICLSLIEIFSGKRNTFHYSGGLKFVDIDKETAEKIAGELDEETGKKVVESGLFELKPTPDFKYHCDIVVNLKNVDRFVRNETERKYCIEHPHELYELKSRYLYHKIRYYKEQEWWD